MRRTRTVPLLLLCYLLTGLCLADQRTEIQKLQRLQPTDAQVEKIFSLFLSNIPALLNESNDGKALMAELAPQALNLLSEEQRGLLEELAPQEQLNRFGSMTQEERTRFLFDSANSLVHPSKQEWLRRMQEMVDSTENPATSSD